VRTQDYSTAIEWSENLLGNSIFIKTWIPQSKFLVAERSDQSLTFAREDNGIYGVAFGREPRIPNNWNRFSIERPRETFMSPTFVQKSEWEVFVKNIQGIEVIENHKRSDFSDEEISDFLTTHAPESSVKPGNKEVLFWAVISEEKNILGVAAVSKWESGRFVVVSVAVDKSKRNRGIGTRVMKEVEFLARKFGIDQLCLGVLSSNQSAIHLYVKSGWSRIHQFAYFERT
jgi:ribosomal protein S18 acetylase RimI-like enzyme